MDWKRFAQCITMPRIITTVVLLDVLFLINYATILVFSHHPPDVPGGTSTAYLGLVGALAGGAYGFYKWAQSRKKTDVDE